MKKIFAKTLKIIGFTIGVILFLMLIFPLFFPHLFSDKIKKWTNNALVTQLNFSEARLSFFNHFPALTLTLHEVSLMGSNPYPTDTLLNADEVSFGIDLTTIFSSSIHIDEIYLDGANIAVKVDKNGAANYNVYKSSPKNNKTSNDTTGTALKIEKIQISNSNLLYSDLSVPMTIKAKNLNYTGEGNFSKAIFDLTSRIRIDSFDLNYNGTQYVQSKKLKGRLITRLNTNSLALEFKKNNLLINSLPVKFTGNFEFLEGGYYMDLKLVSHRGNLAEILSVLPPEYAGWLDNTQTDGKTDVEAYLEGKYVSKDNLMPSLGFNLQIRNGFINNKNTPSPIKNLFLNLDAKFPSLDTDSLYVNIDSLYFNIDKDYLSSHIRLSNLNQPSVHAKVNAEMDLGKWGHALGISSFDVNGKCSLHLTADGVYAKEIVKKGIRQVDTVISSIPHFKMESTLSGGYFKLAYLSNGISNISFQVHASNNDGNYRHINFSIDNLNANALNDFLKGKLAITNLNNIDADLHASIHLDNIKQYYPLDSIDLAGDLNADIISKGQYLPKQKLFPVTTAVINLNNGKVKTSHYPDPVEKIQMVITAVNKKGTLSDLQFDVKPISFVFEGQPFTLNANLQNLENLRYDIASRGVLDVGKLYQVFAQKGLDLKGFIKTNLLLQGLESDATAGRYDRLNNRGIAELRNITLHSDYFPLPFVIKTGIFQFDKDKLSFRKFTAVYGKSTLDLDGYLSNIIEYALKGKAPLSGQFNLSSDHLYADEFAAFSGDATSSASGNTGVVIIPDNLNLRLNAAIREIIYQGLEIDSFKGAISIQKGKLQLDTTSFQLVGAPVTMEASYHSVSPFSADFTYNIGAENFDIQKAYHSVPIFRELVTSASKVKGIVSLNYQLSGRLNANMRPIYPSLKGKGMLSLKDVKVKGLKLIGALSRSTKKDSIDNPGLKEVNIKTTIANNIITLERTRLKIFGFRPRFEGQVSFDGKLDLSGRLGLPPLGIIGIPFSVTGTEENPKIKLKKATASDKLTQTPDSDDIQ